MTIRQRIQQKLAGRHATDPTTMTRQQLLDRVLDLETKVRSMSGRLAGKTTALNQAREKVSELEASLRVWRGTLTK